MTKKMGRPTYTRTMMLRWYRKYQAENLTQEEICAKAGCHLSTLSRWFKKFGDEDRLVPGLAPHASPPDVPPSVSILDEQTQPGTDAALREENSYLRWWCKGERKGWVDRLLKEMQKD